MTVENKIQAYMKESKSDRLTAIANLGLGERSEAAKRVIIKRRIKNAEFNLHNK